ncbi:hypothetical protein ScPMuIL_008931 [Solemya velum]
MASYPMKLMSQKRPDLPLHLPAVSKNAGKRPYRQYNPDALTAAYMDVMEDRMAVKKAARVHDVPETTLRDRVKGQDSIDTVRSGPAPLLSLEAEARLMNHISFMARVGYGYTRSEVCYLATDLATKLGKILAEHDLIDKPQFIYNVDEKGLSDDHNPSSVVTDVKCKPYSVTSGRSSMVTVLGCGNALGSAIPPYFVFPGKRMRAELLEGESTATVENEIVPPIPGPSGFQKRCRKTASIVYEQDPESSDNDIDTFDELELCCVCKKIQSVGLRNDYIEFVNWVAHRNWMTWALQKSHCQNPHQNQYQDWMILLKSLRQRLSYIVETVRTKAVTEKEKHKEVEAEGENLVAKEAIPAASGSNDIQLHGICVLIGKETLEDENTDKVYEIKRTSMGNEVKMSSIRHKVLQKCKYCWLFFEECKKKNDDKTTSPPTFSEYLSLINLAKIQVKRRRTGIK